LRKETRLSIIIEVEGVELKEGIIAIVVAEIAKEDV
jgi:hypothetical protein